MAEIVAWAVLSEGIVLGVIAYLVYAKKKAKLDLCIRTWGEVVDLKQHSGYEGGPTIHPVISFRTKDGQDIVFESKYGSSHCRVKKGDRIRILVNKLNMNDAEVVVFMAQWGLVLVLSIASIGSMVFAPLLCLFLKP